MLAFTLKLNKLFWSGCYINVDYLASKCKQTNPVDGTSFQSIIFEQELNEWWFFPCMSARQNINVRVFKRLFRIMEALFLEKFLRVSCSSNFWRVKLKSNQSFTSFLITNTKQSDDCLFKPSRSWLWQRQCLFTVLGASTLKEWSDYHKKAIIIHGGASKETIYNDSK